MNFNLLVGSLITIAYILCNSFIIISPSSNDKTEVSCSHTQHNTLPLLWETDTLLRTVESVIYDPIREVFYTANIDGHFMNKDGIGSIGKVSLKGEVLDAEWIAGLDAPTGLAIFGDKLYTTDIDRIVEIDIPAARILRVIPIDGAQALNDVTIDDDGIIYVSDTQSNKIFSLRDGHVTVVYDDIQTPNGLVSLNDKLLIGQWSPQTLSLGNPETEEIHSIATEIPQADGIDILGDKGWIISSWGGMVHHISHEGNRTVILDTRENDIHAADVIFVPKLDIIVVACYSNNKLMAYKLKM